MRDPDSRLQVATATETIAHLREQIETLRQQVVDLQGALAAAEGRSEDGQEANGSLVLSALHSEEVAESAITTL